MRKAIGVMLVGFILISGEVVHVGAVVPPSTSMMDEVVPAQTNTSEVVVSLSAASVRTGQIADKLEDDERRLQKVLAQLEADRKKVKEAHDGYSVR